MSVNPLGNEIDDDGDDSDFWSEEEMVRRLAVCRERGAFDEATITHIAECMEKDILTIDCWGNVVWLVPLEQLITEALERKFDAS